MASLRAACCAVDGKLRITCRLVMAFVIDASVPKATLTIRSLIPIKRPVEKVYH